MLSIIYMVNKMSQTSLNWLDIKVTYWPHFLARQYQVNEDIAWEIFNLNQKQHL